MRAGGSPLFVYGVGVPFRVGRFYMNTNNGGKVSNLTVGPTQSIPFTLHHEQGGPTFYRVSAAHRGYLTPIEQGPVLSQVARVLGESHTIKYSNIKIL